MATRTRWICASLTSLALFACGDGGGGDPASDLDAAKAAVIAGDHADALAKFRAVSGNADADDKQKYSAERDSIVCIAAAEDETKAGEAFEKLVTDHGEKVDLDTMLKIGRDLAKTGAPIAATKVVEVAISKFPSDKAKIDTLAKNVMAIAGDNSEAMEALKALGYVGN